MWLFTQDGFYSAVAHRTNPDILVVRARSRVDLEVLIRNHGLKTDIVDTPTGADYPCRILIPRVTWAEVVRAEAMHVDYGNFKAQVEVTIGKWREDVYHRVWYALLDVEKEPGAVAQPPEPKPAKKAKAKQKPRSGKGKARAT